MDLMAIWEGARALWVVWLTLLFIGIVFWAFRPKNKERLEKHADIPLRDDDEDIGG